MAQRCLNFKFPPGDFLRPPPPPEWTPRTGGRGLVRWGGGGSVPKKKNTFTQRQALLCFCGPCVRFFLGGGGVSTTPEKTAAQGCIGIGGDNPPVCYSVWLLVKGR